VVLPIETGQVSDMALAKSDLDLQSESAVRAHQFFAQLGQFFLIVRGMQSTYNEPLKDSAKKESEVESAEESNRIREQHSDRLEDSEVRHLTDGNT
jgi:hypothetical protein